MNHTQLVGTLAFAIAAVACAWRRWPFPTGVFAAGVIELQLGSRFRLHDASERIILPAAAPYADKHSVQLILLAVALVVALLLTRRVVTGPRAQRPARLAAWLILLLLAEELISLHAIDAVMYHAYGGVALIGWCWVACAALATVAALRGRRQGG